MSHIHKDNIHNHTSLWCINGVGGDRKTNAENIIKYKKYTDIKLERITGKMMFNITITDKNGSIEHSKMLNLHLKQNSI